MATTLELRDVDFALDARTIPRDWGGDADPYITTLLGSLSLLFPEGERFFVRSVKQLRDHARGPALGAEIAAFIGQEAIHGREHRALNELLVEHGHPEAPAIEAWLKGFLQRVCKTLSPKSQLAATVALEHFTAIMAERLLSDERMRAEIHDSIRPLWLWHALEESEHKAVAFDLYEAAGGGTARRLGVMMLTTAIFFAVTAAAHARMLARRRLLWRPWRLARGFARAWIYPGHFARLAPAYLAYYAPRFHPNDRDSRALLAHWRAELFGERGSLVERTRRRAA